MGHTAEAVAENIILRVMKTPLLLVHYQLAAAAIADGANLKKK